MPCEHRGDHGWTEVMEINERTKSWHWRSVRTGVSWFAQCGQKPQKSLAETVPWLLALCMFLTATWKYLCIEDLVGISNHKTKPVERSQNRSDLYPTWYIKYERSVRVVGGGLQWSLVQSRRRQNAVISIRQILVLRSLQCEGCCSERESKTHSSVVLLLFLYLRSAALLPVFINLINLSS